MPLKDLKPVSLSCRYPELSVKTLYDEFKSRPECDVYFPPKLNKGRQVDREYFWNIVHTLYTQEVDAMVAHANKQRNKVEEAE